MALISCPECGKEVSDQALACIHCGYPLQSFPPPKRAPRQYSLVFTGLGPHADIPAALHCLSKELGLSQKDAQALLERAPAVLVLDGRDERLKFLGLDGILTATCCPNCVGFLKGPAFNRFTLDGGVEVFPSELFDGAGKMDCYVRPEEYKALTENRFILGKSSVPLFYGAACEDVNTIGGFANWVQDWEYTACPHCGKPMKYLAQIQWDTLMDGTEGTLYVEFCPDCHIVSMQHQQT